MRLVVVTNTEDPLAPIFWNAYFQARGVPPATVVFLLPRHGRSPWRAACEGLLLFGARTSLRWWREGRRVRRLVREAPSTIFPATTEFQYAPTLNRGGGIELLRSAPPDLLVSVGAPEIFKPVVLRTARIGAVNVHNGRLPAYRGLFGTFWEATCGEPWGFTSIHVMEPAVDAGAVLAQSAVPLLRNPLSEVLVAKKRQAGRLLAWLVRFVEEEGALPPACPHNADLRPAYFPWPSLAEVARYRLRRRQLHRMPWPLSQPPGGRWPSGMAVDE